MAQSNRIASNIGDEMGKFGVKPVWKGEEEKGEVVLHVSRGRGGERAETQSVIREEDQHRILQITVFLHALHQAAGGNENLTRRCFK